MTSAGSLHRSVISDTPLAYLHGESGDINTLAHLWVFEDAADRARKRAAMIGTRTSRLPTKQDSLLISGTA